MRRTVVLRFAGGRLVPVKWSVVIEGIVFRVDLHTEIPDLRSVIHHPRNSIPGTEDHRFGNCPVGYSPRNLNDLVSTWRCHKVSLPSPPGSRPQRLSP